MRQMFMTCFLLASYCLIPMIMPSTYSLVILIVPFDCLQNQIFMVTYYQGLSHGPVVKLILLWLKVLYFNVSIY